MFSVDGEVGVEAEGLGEVAGLRAHLARRAAEDVGAAGGRFHDAGENLEGGGFAGAIGADEAEDFAARTSRSMPRTASSGP